jgi:predicted DCC family thiol-disulfide oxidoreductase YuxK
MDWSPKPADGVPDLIVFDGDCVLCSRWARWVDERDRAMRFRFVAIQSEAGGALASRFGVAPDAPETNIVVLAERAYFKFDTVVAILNAVGARRRAWLLSLTPRSWREALYDLIARNRYRWFGRRANCLTPTDAMRLRIVERAADIA